MVEGVNMVKKTGAPIPIFVLAPVPIEGLQVVFPKDAANMEVVYMADPLIYIPLRDHILRLQMGRELPQQPPPLTEAGIKEIDEEEEPTLFDMPPRRIDFTDPNNPSLN